MIHDRCKDDLQAPGYSAVIKRPMSFSQMQTSLAKGEYKSWDLVQRDLETMFNNAMVFNNPTTHYHQKVILCAKLLLPAVRHPFEHASTRACIIVRKFLLNLLCALWWCLALPSTAECGEGGGVTQSQPEQSFSAVLCGLPVRRILSDVSY